MAEIDFPDYIITLVSGWNLSGWVGSGKIKFWQSIALELKSAGFFALTRRQMVSPSFLEKIAIHP